MIDRVIGVYNADGGIVGELRYIVGHVLGTVSCALCDITHSPIRRKREWNRFVDELGITVDLRHLNELTAAERAAVGSAAPVVLAEVNGELITVLDAQQLEGLGGEVDAFAAALRGALETVEQSRGESRRD